MSDSAVTLEWESDAEVNRSDDRADEVIMVVMRRMNCSDKETGNWMNVE
jgi:hypothetical protein